MLLSTNAETMMGTKSNSYSLPWHSLTQKESSVLRTLYRWLLQNLTSIVSKAINNFTSRILEAKP
jgi:flagellar motor switch protein FliM